MKKESLEKTYLITMIIATITLTVALYQYCSTSTSFRIVEWTEVGTLAKVNPETGETQVLKGNSPEDAKWVDISGARGK